MDEEIKIIENSLKNNNKYTDVYISSENKKLHCIVVGEELDNSVKSFKQFYNDNPDLIIIDMELELCTKEQLKNSKKVSRILNDFLSIATHIRLV